MAIIDRIFGRKERSLELDDPYAYDKQDCLSCRVVGSTALVSLGGYVYFSGMKGLRDRHRLIERGPSKYKTGSRQLGILSISATLVGLGIYRMVN